MGYRYAFYSTITLAHLNINNHTHTHLNGQDWIKVTVSTKKCKIYKLYFYLQNATEFHLKAAYYY